MRLQLDRRMVTVRARVCAHVPVRSEDSRELRVASALPSLFSLGGASACAVVLCVVFGMTIIMMIE